MNIDWSSVLQTLTATSVVIAALAWLAKTLITHVLNRNLGLTEARLQARHEHELAALRRETEKELVRLQAAMDTELETLRLQANRALEAYRAHLTAAESKRARITNEVVAWSNLVLDAVDGLENCLGNILDNGAYCLLSKKPQCDLNRNWSLSPETFMPNVLYQFSRYFCTVGLLNEALSYELFESKYARDEFFARMRAVSRALSGFPHKDLPDHCSQWSLDEPIDAQMFGSEQASLGGVMRARGDGKTHCLPYADFIQTLNDPALDDQLVPLQRFLDGVNPDSICRWRRLQLMRQELVALQNHWESILEQSLATRASNAPDSLATTQPLGRSGTH